MILLILDYNKYINRKIKKDGYYESCIVGIEGNQIEIII